MTQSLTIDVLKDPETGEVRYIGQAEDPQRRLAAHLTEARHAASGQAKGEWVRNLISKGAVPSLVILDVADEDTADEVERKYISRHLAGGALVNTKHNPEQRDVYLTWRVDRKEGTCVVTEDELTEDELMENFTMRIPRALRRRIHIQATREQQSDSQMGRILIEEALVEREQEQQGRKL